MSILGRIFIGALGGLAAWMSKLLALDAGTLSQLVEQELWLQASDMKVSIFVILPILMFLGAVIAGLTDETLRLKLFAIGVSAPAIIAPWTAKSTLPELAGLPPVLVGQAHAQAVDPRQQRGVVDGIKVLLGITPIPDPASERYWVIASSHADLDAALAAAAQINAADPDLKAFVGNRAPGNPFYPVIVGGPEAYLPLPEAQSLMNQAQKEAAGSKGSYLSAYPDRVPDGAPR